MTLDNHMVTYSTQRLDSIFSALGDPTRRAIVAQLARRPSAVTRLAAPHNMSLQGVMKHLDVLERAGLVSREKQGRVVECRLNAKALQTAEDWISEYRRFWDRQFDSLDDYLNANKEA